MARNYITIQWHVTNGQRGQELDLTTVVDYARNAVVHMPRNRRSKVDGGNRPVVTA